MYLNKWNYTKEEWKHYLNWKYRKSGRFISLFISLVCFKKNMAPEVRISTDRVWINNEHKPFQNRKCQLRYINIIEEQKINILEIGYEQKNKIIGINVPIPRGKLREAIEIQQRLLLENESIG